MVGPVIGYALREICCCARLVGSVDPHPPVGHVPACAARKTEELLVDDVETTAGVWVKGACSTPRRSRRLQFDGFRYELYERDLRSCPCPEVCKV